MNQDLFTAVDQYIDQLVAPEDTALKGVLPALDQAGMPQISISPNQGKFLHMLAKLCRAERILEIGTLGGYSTIWLARALPETGRLISLELEPAYAEVARNNIARAGQAEKVTVRVGKALDILPQLHAEQAGPFDLIFIDADKPPYAEYFQWALKLARPGSLIVADNIIRDGAVADPDSRDEMVNGAQRFNKLVAETPEVSASILQTVGAKGYDGMAFAVVL
jgi:caffeoyl-CoA O-methyltransferase